jgi:hypothetical protein
MPLVEEGTRVWLEIGDSSLFDTPLPTGVIASAFANRELHLVVANYGRSPVEVKTASQYVVSDSDTASDAWNIPARSLVILRRYA